MYSKGLDRGTQKRIKQRERERENKKDCVLVWKERVVRAISMGIVLLSSGSSRLLLFMMIAISGSFTSFTLLIQLLLMAEQTTTTTGLSTTQTNGRHQPISEAHELYCNHCHFSCNKNKNNDNSASASNKALRKKQDDDEPNRDNHDGSILKEQNETLEAKIRLQCKCESVFDTKTRTITCKNMSAANAGLSIVNNKENKTNQARLETRALARSQQNNGPRIIVTERH